MDKSQLSNIKFDGETVKLKMAIFQVGNYKVF